MSDMCLFITANNNEREAFLSKLENQKVETYPNGTVCNCGIFGKYNVVHYHLPKQGRDAELKILNAIEAVNPSIVILVGIACGADKNSQKIGEILISERMLDYDARKEDVLLGDTNENIRKIILRGVDVPSGPKVSGLFHGLSYNWEGYNYTKTYFGGVISGSFLLNNPNLKIEIFNEASKKFGKGAIGYEMEGASAFRTCHEKGITEWILVKAISDFGDGCKNKDRIQEEKDQKLAASNAVSLCHYVFQQKIFMNECVVQADEYYEAIIKYHTDKKYIPEQKIKDESALNEKAKRLITKLELDSEIIELKEAIVKLRNEIMLISGAGGTGKTFMLLHEIVQLRSDKQNKLNFIYIALNELNFASEQTIENYIKTEIFSRLDWKNKYNSRNGDEILFFLDGFNEIPHENRTTYGKQILRLQKDLNVKLIIASRYEDVLEGDSFRNIIRTSMCPLTPEDIQSYLEYGENKKANDLNAELLNLLVNPLLLTLYSETSQYSRKRIINTLKDSRDRFEDKKKLCKWISSKDRFFDSSILWNYLCCEIMKINMNSHNVKEILVLNYLSIQFIWPQIAFFMQSKNSFLINGEMLFNCVNNTIEWVRENLNSNYELNRFQKEAYIFGVNPIVLKEIVDKIDITNLIYKLSTEQSFFSGKPTTTEIKYKFMHQSMRDCLAAIHLINIHPTKENPFSNEWKGSLFSENIYMLRHLTKLIVSFNITEILDIAINALRGRNINKGNNIIKNLLLVYNQELLLNGNFTRFDFSNLDLKHCELTDFKVSDNDYMKGANFSGAIIGEDTFKLPAHARKITSIAVSSNGRKVLSCGKDKVLLWNFGDRTVDKELYYYADIFGEQEKNINQVAFNSTDDSALYTNESKLFVYNFKTEQTTEYINPTAPITSILATIDDAKNEYYLALAKNGNILRWRKDHLIPDKIIQSNNDIFIISPTYNPNEFLACDHKNQFVLVDEWLNVIRKYGIRYTGGTVEISRDKSYFVISNFKKNDKGIIFVDSFSIVGIHNNIIQLVKLNGSFLDIVVSMSSRGNYLLVATNDMNEQKSVLVYHKLCQQFVEQPLENSNLSRRSDISTLTIYENYIFFVENYTHIKVDCVVKDDKSYYGCTFLDNHLPFVKSIAFSHVNGNVFVVYEDGYLREWDYNSGTFHPYPKKYKTCLTSVAVAHDENLLVCGDVMGNILLYDFDEKRFVRKIGNVESFTDTTWDGFADIAWVNSFSYDDKYIIAISGDSIISVWSVLGNDEVPLFYFEHNHYITSCLYYETENEKRIVIGDRQGNLSIYRISIDDRRLDLVLVKSAHPSERILSLALSPNKSRFISYGEDSYIREWQTQWQDENNVLICEKEITSTDTVNASSCKYSHDGTLVYVTVNNGKSIFINEISFGNDKEDTLIHMKHFRFSNEGIIANNHEVILSGDYYGKLHCYSPKKEIKTMAVPAMSFEKTKYCTGFDSAKYYPDHLKSVYTGRHIVNGKLPEWLKTGIIPNLVTLPYHNDLSDDVAENLSNLSIEQRYHLISELFISTASGGKSISPHGETTLLEACLLYLYYEAPTVEQNMMMISALIRAGYSEENNNEDDFETDLYRLFNMLEDKDKSHIALKIWQDYLDEFGDNNRDVCESILRKIDALNIFYKFNDSEYSAFLFGLEDKITNEEEVFPNLTQEKIYNMAVSIACNSDAPKSEKHNSSSCCIDYFTDTDKAQVLFLQLFLTYINQLPEKERINKSQELFESTVDEFLKIVTPIASPEMMKIIKKLEKYKNVYSKVLHKNQFVRTFWKEFR